MKNWRLAKSLETLRAQLNEQFPLRSKVSDGSVGDLGHSQRKSDHNPNSRGVVTAIDVTNDPARDGLSGQKLADALYRSRDPRIKYLIFNRRITTLPFGTGWKPYKGANAHAHHVHISVHSAAAFYDSDGKWNLGGLINPLNSLSAKTPEVVESKAVNPKDAFQPLAETAENLSSDAGGENSADNSNAKETTASATVETATGQVKQEITTKNEQNVNDPADVGEPKPQGFKAKLTAGVATLLGGTILYDGIGKIAGIQFTTQNVYIICFVLFLGFLGFCVWAVLDTWKKNKKVELEVLANTDITRKNINWVKPDAK